ncbi:MAG: ABC transporter substrate-binding protein [Pseudomonadota bacterium]
MRLSVISSSSSGTRACATWAAAILLVASSLFVSAAPARADAPVTFMKRVAKELLAAHRANSQTKMARVIRRNADVVAIGRFSLGTYYARLERNRRSSYFNGMTKFMARYLIDQSKTYRVARAEVLRPSVKRGRDFVVNSRVTLVGGGTYTVQWLIGKRGGKFRIRDANVLGYWALPLQRNLFRDYVRKANGDVNALVLALNQ